MKDLVVRLKPDCFDDLVALVALFRPGAEPEWSLPEWRPRWRRSALERAIYGVLRRIAGAGANANS